MGTAKKSASQVSGKASDVGSFSAEDAEGTFPSEEISEVLIIFSKYTALDYIGNLSGAG